MRLSEIMVGDRGKWLVVTSSCPFTLQVAERGLWQAVVITCKTCLFQSMIWTNVSKWPMLVVRMHLWKSSGCYVYECRVPLLEVVRIGEARHVYFGKIRMRLIRMRMCVTHHQEMCATCGEGSLHWPILIIPKRLNDNIKKSNIPPKKQKKPFVNYVGR